MTRSAGFRFFTLGVLTLLMFIPLFFVGAIIDARATYSRLAIETVGRTWGGPQILGGPLLIIPVEGPVTHIERQEVTDPLTGVVRTVANEITEIERKASLYIQPETFDVAIMTETSERKRGIFRVPVFSATSEMRFDFDVSDAGDWLDADETALWADARLVMGLSDNRALRGTAQLRVDGADVPLGPRSGTSGIQAALGDPRDLSQFVLQLGFNGAERLSVAPVGRNSSVTVASDWPHPSFDGAFLPDASEITEAGFEANWSIPALARSLPHVSRENHEAAARNSAFGVQFYQPNDFYQKAYRAARYGILFIALTFLTVFLIDNRSERPVHPVQYILIGLAQSIFVLLMVAYAEQIGFGAAYALSTVATVGLLIAFGATGLRLGRRTWVLGAMLILLYAVLYLILRSADYALLAGSTLAFGALAGTVYATRNEDWYGPEKPPRTRRGLLDRLRAAPEVPPEPPADPAT